MDKFIAPPWIKYPTQPECSSFWKDGSAAEYLIKFNENVDDMDAYLEIFPKAATFLLDIKPSDELSSQTIDYIESSKKPIFVNLWTPEGKPKYSIGDTIADKHVYMYERLLTDKSAHFHIGDYGYDSATELIDKVRTQINDEYPEIWDEIKYTVYLNCLYYKLVTDMIFINEVIKTGDNEILFISDNLEYGVQEEDGKLIGENLVGLALMEIRDHIKEVYKNYDDIDWDISGEPYSKQRCNCMLHE